MLPEEVQAALGAEVGLHIPGCLPLCGMLQLLMHLLLELLVLQLRSLLLLEWVLWLQGKLSARFQG